MMGFDVLLGVCNCEMGAAAVKSASEDQSKNRIIRIEQGIWSIFPYYGKKNKVVEISYLSFMERPGDSGVSDLELFPLKLPLKPPFSETKLR